MGSITRSHSFVSGEKPTESEWNVDIDQLFTLISGQIDTNNVDTTSSDGVSVLNANQTVSGTRSHSSALTMTNDVDLIFGTDSDIKIRYDETTDDALRIDTGVEGAPLAIVLKADQGDDAGDAWKVNLAASAGVLTFGNDLASKGTYVTQLTLTPHATVASSTTAIAGHATVGGNLTVTGGVTVDGASAFDIGDSDKLLLGTGDDLTLYHDGSNSYITNATGALKVATETSGIAVTIGHTTSETTIADNATVTGTLGAGATTLASLICTAAGTFGGGTGSDGATITTDGAGTFDGILKTEDDTDATSTTDGSLQTDGGLSVALDVIAGNDVKLLTDSSVLSLGVGSDATLTHDGTTGVTIAANPIIVDSGDALTLDAHTGIFVFKDAGTEVLRFTEGNSGDVTVKLAINGKDLVFTDNGDATNMKILDAAAGINVPGEVQTTKIAYTDGDDAITIADGGGVTTASTLTVGSVVNAGTDTNKFLVLDGSGNVDFRTGAEVLSDIGAEASGAGDITSVVAGTGLTGGATSGAATVNVIGGDGITANANDVAITAAQTTITSIYATDLIIGEDSETAIDFGTADEIDFKINNTAELTLSATALYPIADAGLDLGTSALGYNDLHLGAAGIINFDNANMKITHSTGVLTVAGGTFAAAAITGTTLSATGDISFDGGSFVFNDAGADKDFRIEGDAQANLFFVDASVDTINLRSTASLNVASGAQTLGIHGEAAFYRQEGNAYGRSLTFAKSRGSGVEIVLDNDALGYICWAGADGVDDGSGLATCAAMIHAEVDGTPGSNDMPGRLIFSTTADGAAAVTERMRIDNAGNVGIGTTAPGTDLEVRGPSGRLWAYHNIDC